MKYTISRTVCLILAVLTVVGTMFSLPAAALPLAHSWSYDVIDGEAMILGYSGPGGDLTIPETLDGYRVTMINSEAFEYKDTITSVKIPESVRFVGSGAFLCCSNLKQVSLPSGTKEISSDLFMSCTSLESISIPSGVTSIGRSAFRECRKLTKITLPKGVTVIGNSAFMRCDSLTEITIPDSVTSIGESAFLLCSSLKKITIGRGVMTLGWDAFSDCTSLKDIYFMGTREKWKSFGDIQIPSGAVVHYENQTSFNDVPDDAYYAEPVKWAIGKGITSGTSAVTFSPNDGCTRGQVVTFLWRLAGSRNAVGSSRFSDVLLSDYFYKPVLWATEKKITSGATPNKFAPTDTCTRGQIVTFLWRAAGSPRAIATGDFFRDVHPDDYYYTAVVWATQKGITKGTSATMFSPSKTCTRAEVVTFLYRNAK